MSAILNFDATILNFIYDNMRCAFLDFIMPLITHLGEAGIFFICVAVFLLIFKKTRKTGAMLGLSLIIGLIVCNLTLKPLVARPRPYEELRPGVELLVGKLSDFSFPSGHTVAAFEAASVLMMRNKKAGIPFLVLAVLIAFSRLYLYVHYPTDVIVGAIIGTISGIVAVKVVEILWGKIANKLRVKKEG